MKFYHSETASPPEENPEVGLFTLGFDFLTDLKSETSIIAVDNSIFNKAV